MSSELTHVERTAYFYGGAQYCFYAAGWHGPGFYQCGFAYRRGYGWGGPAGWRGWGGGPRRFHGRPEYGFYGGRGGLGVAAMAMAATVMKATATVVAKSMVALRVCQLRTRHCALTECGIPG